MFGIAGSWDITKQDKTAQTMAAQLSNCGPDSASAWSDDLAGIELAHRRFSIMDLSQASHQPMVSPCGRYVIVYNGEVYNHTDLRAELEAEGGHFAWRGHSDTEMLLAALQHWGVEAALSRLNGMFAFALWDVEQRSLVLARDRLGEKPLYYGRVGNTFLFGSDLASLRTHRDWRGEVDRNALALYMRYGYVPAPYSIYRDIVKLPAAHYVVIDNGGSEVSEPRRYWDLPSIAVSGYAQPDSRPAEVLVGDLDELLRDAVFRRMAAGGSAGAFLSGGYDSSTVTALMQAQSTTPIKTFAIGFHEGEYDEAAHARVVAAHLGTDHTELYIGSDNVMAVLPELPGIWDEPFADASQIPTLLANRLAGESVKACLSGDGGDELFCGYNRYIAGYRIWKRMRLLPYRVRRLVAGLLARLPVHAVAKALEVLPVQLPVAQVEDKLPKLASALAQPDGAALYRDLVSHWKAPTEVVLGAEEPEFSKAGEMTGISDLRQQMMLWDTVGYLTNNGLVKTGRAAHAAGISGRSPLLDHRVVEFAWRVPISVKYHVGQGKWLLRQVLYRYMPQKIMDRPKMGFSVPVGQWLRGPLRDWAETFLEEQRLQREGFFDPAPVRQMWQEHLSGNHNHARQLWTFLMFEAWLEASA